MSNVVYTAEAHVQGGRREGHGRTSDGELDVQLRAPGTGGRANPEQLFAVGYAACYESALRAIARHQRIKVGSVSIDAKVDLVKTTDTQFDIGVHLHVHMPHLGDGHQARALADQAHEMCPYFRATRGNIEVEITTST